MARSFLLSPQKLTQTKKTDKMTIFHKNVLPL